MSAVELPDAADRAQATSSLAETLFVGAGAGSGKTYVLVSRLVALVVDDGVPLRTVAAVTFTEKAAAELRDRVRVALEGVCGAGGDAEARARAGLDDLDTAAIGTLHSFARRVLSEHPIEAGLPPLVDVLDDVASQVAADRRWSDIRATLLTDPDAAPLLRMALSAGLKVEHLAPVAKAFDADWDLVDDRLADSPAVGWTGLDVAPIVRQARSVAARSQECRDSNDHLAGKLKQLREWADRLDASVHDGERLAALAGVPKAGGTGKAPNWPGGIAAVRDAVTDLRDSAESLRARAFDHIVSGLLRCVARCTLAAAAARRESGRLEFHDLLVLSRRLVRSATHGVHVRAQLAARYQRILLDEFQDTDPIQVELAVRIAGGAAAGAADWREVAVPAGSLFVVGDAKQSIYRFRRADIGTYLAAAGHLGSHVELTTNFRSSDAILDWVNTVFGRLIVEEAGAQPSYVPLAAAPSRPAWSGAGPGVVVLGAQPHRDKPSADQLRAREAVDVAGLIVQAMAQGWEIDVRDGSSWLRRPLRLDDVTVLVPTRTSIAALETALDAADIAYRTEAAALVYGAAEVHDVLLVARAVDDPSDQLAVVAALRTPLFGCGDDDLWQWKAAHGRWNVFSPPPASIPADSPVLDGVLWLRSLARERALLSPSEVIGRIVSERRVLEASVDSPRYRETWRRMRFVVDQARAWSEAEHGSLREYLSWARRQADERARVSEAVLPETDSDAIRITTVHAAKGLQFPFVIVSGLTSGGLTTPPAVIWPVEGGCEAQLNAKIGARTAGYAAACEREKHLESCEDVRLLYVACTRAETHLAVSLHRRDPTTHKGVTPATVLAAGCLGAPHEEFTASPGPRLPGVTRRPMASLSSFDSWSAAHSVVVARSEAPEAVSVTDVAHRLAPVELPAFVRDGLAKQPRDLDLPAWAKGRYGSAVGRAVHAVLQSVTLSNPLTAEAVSLSAAQALAEGVPDAAELVASLVLAALTSDVVRRAGQSPHWRETYVGTEVLDAASEPVVVEGYIDLLYRDHSGLVIVDYKTDAAVSGESLAAYETQLSVYAKAVEDAVGEPVAGCVLLLLRPEGALQHSLRPGTPKPP